ncbi:MAG TPA: YkgJ family cysteine cluster protein [Phycisphaerae bacterium]|nr:YkgJ family cysteine cluster protein [Phycisphaerae bacterium]
MSKRCLECNAKCCRYFCLEIDKPETFDDFENIRWYMLHEKVTAHIDDEGDWCLLIDNLCKMLVETPAGARCKDYANRPMICRRFDPDDCEFTHGRWDYEELFSTPDQIDAYARRMLGEPAYERGRARMLAMERDGRRPARRAARTGAR